MFSLTELNYYIRFTKACLDDRKGIGMFRR